MHEAIGIAEELGWMRTNSWREKGRYSASNPSRDLIKLLEPYRMTPEAWWCKVVGPSIPRGN